MKLLYLSCCKHGHRKDRMITDFVKVTLKIGIDKTDGLSFVQ